MEEQPVHAASGQGLGHDGVEAGWVDVAGYGQAALLIGGVDHSIEGLGGVLAAGQHAYVIDHDQSERQMRATTLGTEASTLARVTVVVSDSSENQARRSPGSQLVRPTPGSSEPAGWAMEERSGRQLSKVLPEGKPAARRRIARVAASRPLTSSAKSTRNTSAGSQR